MQDLKPIIAKNIIELRTSAGMTQLELAEKLHYSDKAVSKWERGDSIPEIGTLKAIAELYGVTVDYLISSEPKKTPPAEEKVENPKAGRKNRAIITEICLISVWLVSVFVYVMIDIISVNISVHWLTFVYTVPVTFIVWLIFNSIWFNRRRNYLIISLLVWSLLAAVHITFFAFGTDISMIYAVGLPAQVIILLCSKFLSKTNK